MNAITLNKIRMIGMCRALWVGMVMGVILNGCASVPPTNVHQPMTARPQPRPENLAANGSIFQGASYRPLFEDRRARLVGDTLTISITENTNASTNQATKSSRDSSIKTSVPLISGLPGKSLQGMGLDASSNSAMNGQGQSNNTNVFTGTITATVIEVLPNGNLLVSGEKQVAIGSQQEFVRFSGVVNPLFIGTNNTIPSSQVADARIEYKSTGSISESQIMGWMARFFLNVLPF